MALTLPWPAIKALSTAKLKCSRMPSRRLSLHWIAHSVRTCNSTIRISDSLCNKKCRSLRRIRRKLIAQSTKCRVSSTTLWPYVVRIVLMRRLVCKTALNRWTKHTNLVCCPLSSWWQTQLNWAVKRKPAPLPTSPTQIVWTSTQTAPLVTTPLPLSSLSSTTLIPKTMKCTTPSLVGTSKGRLLNWHHVSWLRSRKVTRRSTARLLDSLTLTRVPRLLPVVGPVRLLQQPRPPGQQLRKTWDRRLAKSLTRMARLTSNLRFGALLNPTGLTRTLITAK